MNKMPYTKEQEEIIAQALKDPKELEKLGNYMSDVINRRIPPPGGLTCSRCSADLDYDDACVDPRTETTEPDSGQPMCRTHKD